MRTLSILTAALAALSLTGASFKERPKTCRIGPIRVGVIDTGFGYNDLGHDAPLCKYGHKDFSLEQKFSGAFATKVPIPMDVHGHGTNVVGLIDEFAKKGANDYCLVIIKYYLDSQNGSQNLNASIQAFEYANNLKLDVINYSGGGEFPNDREQKAIKKFLDRGGIFVSAAGNEGQLLDGVLHAYYPAMYDKRITVVGNNDLYGIRVPSSNFGPVVTTWENGYQQIAYGITMTGTSQATAVSTGKHVASIGSCDR